MTEFNETLLRSIVLVSRIMRTSYSGKGLFPHVVDLGLTLRAGQVFSWQYSEDTDEWVGVLNNTVFWLRQSENNMVTYRYEGGLQSDEDARGELDSFFQVHIPLQEYLKQWGQICELFDSCILGSKFATGLRICRQEPFECLISFIVSANNHIKRISKNLVSIRAKYGTRVQTGSNIEMFTFPTPQQLAVATVDELRELGLGYRAPYIVQSVRAMVEGSLYEEMLAMRAAQNISHARKFLTQFQGVGRKVADCVALYSLDYHDVAPVDTHILKIAQRIFKGSKINKDNGMHDKIQELMRERYGAQAGIAHCYLFAADLTDLADPKPKHRKLNSSKD